MGNDRGENHHWLPVVSLQLCYQKWHVIQSFLIWFILNRNIIWGYELYAGVVFYIQTILAVLFCVLTCRAGITFAVET